MGRKAAGPVCYLTPVKEPSVPIEKRRGSPQVHVARLLQATDIKFTYNASLVSLPETFNNNENSWSTWHHFRKHLETNVRVDLLKQKAVLLRTARILRKTIEI